MGRAPSRGVPSPKLQALVESVAYHRRVEHTPRIAPEVALAFGDYLHRGVTLAKFVPNGPPHDRLFVFEFLDLQHSTLSRGSSHGVPVPEAVWGWYRHSNSRIMRRYYPLHDLVRVIAGGAGHPLVEKRRVKSDVLSAFTSSSQTRGTSHIVLEGQNHGALRGNHNTLRGRKYITDAYVLQLTFASLAGSETTLAVMTGDPAIYLALRVVAEFITRI